MKYIKFLTSLLVIATATAHASISTFDDLALAPNSFFAGTPLPGGNTTQFTSGPASYYNLATDFGGGATAWEGWAYSNMTDTTTPGFMNQYSAIAGSGLASANYGVSYAPDYNPNASRLSFTSATLLSQAFFTNTTYTALSMQAGDSFAKKFGGTSGNDPDWLKLTVTGKNNAAATGAVDFYLADFRFADNSLDYIVSPWTAVDLAGLGAVNELVFTLSSSDTAAFGMNTPAYFAMENLTAVPVPGALWLMASGLLVLFAGRRRSPT